MTAPIETGWYDVEQSIIVCRFHAHWRWEDLRVAFVEVTALTLSKPYLVDCILCQAPGEIVTHPDWIPANIIAELVMQRPANAGLCVVVSALSAARSLVRIAARLVVAPLTTIMIVPTLEAALTAIQQRRATRLSA